MFKFIGVNGALTDDTCLLIIIFVDASFQKYDIGQSVNIVKVTENLGYFIVKKYGDPDGVMICLYLSVSLFLDKLYFFSQILTPKIKQSEEDEVLNLLKQTTEEVGIDEKFEENTDDEGQNINEKISDMEDRLLKLKGVDPGIMFTIYLYLSFVLMYFVERAPY